LICTDVFLWVIHQSFTNLRIVAVLVKSQQWPTPSESIAIYLHKETSFVFNTSSVLRGQ